MLFCRFKSLENGISRFNIYSNALSIGLNSKRWISGYSSGSYNSITIKHDGRCITLDVRGVPRLSKRKFFKSQHSIELENRNLSKLSFVVSEIPKYDALCIGISKNELSLLRDYLDKTENKDLNSHKDIKKFKSILINKQYSHIIPLLKCARSLSISFIDVGRERHSELEAFSEAALNNKRELLSLFLLYLQNGNVLQDGKTLEEFSKSSPTIYSSIVQQSALYIMHRLHSEIYEIKRSPIFQSKSKNLHLLLVVEEHLKGALINDLNAKFPLLFHHKNVPDTLAMKELERTTLANWSKFVFCFLVFPTVAFFGFFALVLKFYSMQVARDSEICISDDFATDVKRRNIIGFWKNSGKADSSRD
ncbi:hypothetical protein BdWA1_000583 [Babesia duncani]|uniref:Uncharacterized protein n=1 Tax=Babesia duncani TaxID=323732 RepID=A0AAD9PMF4_9APIC|nr:hypothetical protein BdWA1_000583 [Babesia duncani]